MEFPVQRWDISSLRAILLQPIPPSQSPARADVVEGTLDVFCEFRKFKPRLCQYDTSNQVFSWQNLDEDRSPSAKGSLVVTFVSELELDVTTYKLKYRASHKFDIELAEMTTYKYFSLWTTSGMQLCRTGDLNLFNRFYGIIREDLMFSRIPSELWNQKESAFKRLEPNLQVNYLRICQMKHVLKLLAELDNTLIAGVKVNPIRSPNKEKAGILTIMNDSPEGEEIYFVLMMNCLHLYKNSKSEFPTSYVPIEKGFAFVSLNNDAFAAGNFVISLETPVRSLLLKAKHEIALAEWLVALYPYVEAPFLRACERDTVAAALDRQLSLGAGAGSSGAGPGSNGAGPRSGSGSSAGAALFASDEYRAFDEDDQQLLNASDADAEAGGSLECLSFGAAAVPEVDVPRLDFDAVTNVLKQQMRQLLKSPKDKAASNSAAQAAQFERLVPNMFPEGHNLVIHIRTVKSRQDEMKDAIESEHVIDLTDKSKSSCLVGRDFACDVLLPDARVSRTHARIDYEETKAEYFDLGSAHGSLLNGQPVIRARLAPNDVLRLGNSTLTIELKKRTFASFFGF